MKKGEYYEGIIEKVQFPNRGIATAETRKSGPERDAETVEGPGADIRVIVKNGIPGQRILYRICKKRHGVCEGQLLRVLEKSPLETEEAGCSIFPACGGCMYRTMAYPAQLEMKAQQIRELLGPVVDSSSDPEQRPFEDLFEGILPSPIANGYRNKMEYAFGDAEPGGPLTLGLHKKGSTYDILTAADCRIVHEDFNRIVRAVLTFCREQGWTYYHKKTHRGYLRHLLVRRAVMTGEILVDLVTSSQYGGTDDSSAPDELSRQEEREALQQMSILLRKLPLEGELAGVLHTVNDSVADMIRNDRTEILYGQDCFYEKLLGLEFQITPFSFFQTNSMGAEVLYTKVREYIGDLDGRTVFDLYSGTGTIAQILAPVCSRVVGVEIVDEAVAAARENAMRNHLTNCEFLAGDVLKVLDEIPEKPDAIILDPPRDGVHPKALPKILAYGVDKIVYVSCKATSLARDLPVIMAHGYRVDRISCVDMFPGTVHCEVIALLSNRK